MKKFVLYIETIDENTSDIIFRKLEDICYADSIDDCLEQTDWENYDVESNEQICIEEMDNEGFVAEEYYPLYS